MNDHSNNDGFNNSNHPNGPSDHTRDQLKETEAKQHAFEQQPQQQYTQANEQQQQFNQQPYNQQAYNQQPYNQEQYNQQQAYNHQQAQQQQSNYQQYGQYPPPPPNGYGYPPYPVKKTNTKSIVGLILGIAAILLPYIGFLIGIAGIFVNAISLKEIKARAEDGKGLAIAGLVTSIIGTALYLIVILFIVLAITLFSTSIVEYY